jgi:hypothetical protein
VRGFTDGVSAASAGAARASFDRVGQVGRGPDPPPGCRQGCSLAGRRGHRGEVLLQPR